ncbi:restriction endonuclease [Sphingomonas pokkalii]|uniref:Restriction endonuclease n=1 Tax=Sphingomonas pokkalii TaxID=2175090 RepID=A0A2U0SG01_9SPHN|nr:restriction endonuclease [Sphingomonas pokkalii]PVX30224.1 restriction endonuclease [Sphingomonas pokkalii]
MTIPLPKHDDLMLPTLQVLAALGGSGSNDEIAEALMAKLGLSEAQMGVLYPKTGLPILPDRMTWARSYLKFPGFVENPKRGVWVLTEEGRVAAAWDDAAVRKAVAKAYAERHARKKAVEAEAPEAEDAEAAEAEWTDQMLAVLRAMDPIAFERLCQRLLRESGFVKVEVTGRSGDGGIDGTGVLRMNLISFQVLFQCKRYAGSVSSPTVRDFRGAMQGRADKGLILTTGSFTLDAEREARRDGAPAIDLIDGRTLCQLLKDARLGVKVEMVEQVTVLPDFFAEI